MKRQGGVALVLVLAVTGVLALLALQIALTAKSQVRQAQALSDRAEAELKLHSEEAALIFSLLTNEPNADPRRYNTAEPNNPYAKAWNFRGELFEVNGGSFLLQDVGGLFPMPLPTDPPEPFADLLVALGFDSSRAMSVSRSLSLSAPAEQGIPLQSFKELVLIGSLTRDEIDRLEAVASLSPGANRNPNTAPPAVISATYSEVVLEPLLSARRMFTLDSSSIQEITGRTLDESAMTSLIGPYFRIDVTVERRGSRLRRQSIWAVRPQSISEPLRLFSYRDLNPEPRKLLTGIKND